MDADLNTRTKEKQERQPFVHRKITVEKYEQLCFNPSPGREMSSSDQTLEFGRNWDKSISLLYRDFRIM